MKLEMEQRLDEIDCFHQENASRLDFHSIYITSNPPDNKGKYQWKSSSLKMISSF